MPVTSAASAIKAGTVAHFAASSAPAGWIKANGAAISRATYAALFLTIGTTYGAGDGSTTFNIPDLRGEFLRSWDDGRGVDSGRSFGSEQLDATQRVVGKFRMAHASGLVSQATAGFVNPFEGTDGASAWRDQIESPGSGFYAMEFDNSRSARTASENRPRNIALLACIKY